ncbi:HupE/UreJ family protein [Litorimonas sp.]|uniref:HupE/UreJ family protein n=1 Tax=Litorimonas sp. TaxID=1892381 RepID=UPI003A8C3B68
MRVFLIILGSIFLMLSSTATAHEINPGYLEITEVERDGKESTQAAFIYDTIWKAPLRLGRPLAVIPEMPGDCLSEAVSTHQKSGGVIFIGISFICEKSLQGRSVVFAGLDSTVTDVLTRFQPLSGEQQTLRASPSDPEIQFTENPTRWDVSKTYFVLGVEHIWFGFDHLLFVLGLVLLIKGKRRIFETITAFTLAHSVTLIATTLGWVSLSIKPVEAVIALSILFLASEIAQKKPDQMRFTEQRPWIFASAFGLLHGFGFASALANIGMPYQQIPTALLTFNLGVEFGQIAFVGVILVVIALADKIKIRRPAELLSSYFIGSLSMFWVLQRIM